MLGFHDDMCVHGHGHGLMYMIRKTLRTSRLAGLSDYNLARPGRYGVRFPGGGFGAILIMLFSFRVMVATHASFQRWGGWDGLIPH